jgi:Xaa-Pro aminopeptidase
MTTPNFTTPAEHIKALRGQLNVLDVDAFVVPRFDAHQGEYIAAHDERLRFLTGFSGSAGMAIVTHDTVAMFVDGRYSVQVREECAGDMFSHHHLFDSPPETWLAQHLPAGSRVGFDPMHLPPVWFDRFANAAASTGTTMQPTFANPIDTIWNDQPPKPEGQVVTMPLQFAGRGFNDKLAALIEIMTQQDVHFHVETQPDNIAWFLNVRGDDVAFLPVPLSFLIVARTGVVSWFIAPGKLNQDVKDALPDMVHCLDPNAFLHALRDTISDSDRVSIDPDFSPVAVRSVLEDKGANIQVQRSPLTLAKMIKNPTELEGLRACHIQDGVAVTEFSAWLIDQVPKQAAIGTPLTERDAEAKILALRQEHTSYLGDSFNTISAAGGNAAMCHYATSETSNAPILPTAAYLLDSGGQYETGTTDISRSFTFGTLPEGYAQAYTAVFKGFHALSTLQFPRGTQGHQRLLVYGGKRGTWPATVF